jgi:aryl-phospho-beta-D-glucosidase BglC (GH1 family)
MTARQGPMVKTLYVRLAVLALSLISAACCANAAGLPPLHAQGRDIRDSAGKVVHLHGVNVGGWLVSEAWMCGQTDDGKRRALEQLEKRFGDAKAATLMKAWQDNWITTQDLDAIKSYGCNLLRVPFHYRTLQDAQGNWYRDASKKNVDFSRMDWIVTESQSRGMYVIFDLHVWPGEYQAISRDTPDGKQARAKMAALWAEVARHYKGVGSIAAFDVINEPEGSPGNILQKTFYDAIRSRDPQRMLVFESVAYPSIRTERWTNIVWSAHYPERTGQGSVAERLDAFDQKEKLSATAAVQVPVFIGECKATEDNSASADEMATAFNKRGWHWAVWTYKGVDNGGWASVNYDRSLKYNLAEDPYEAILEKWTTGLSQWRESGKAETLHKTGWWIEGFGKGFRGGGD